MKIESYHQAYDLLEQCAREADQMNQAEVRMRVENARQELWNAWNLLQAIENGEVEDS